jgi:hypothetical protein
MSTKPFAICKKICINYGLLLLLAISGNNSFASAVYKVDLKKRLHGSNVLTEIDKLNAPGSITILKLSNVGTQTVGCRAIFDPRIDQKKTFKRLLKPNTEVSIRHSTSRTPNRVKIDLQCHPLQKKPTAEETPSRAK